jgi:hypothetical protein
MKLKIKAAHPLQWIFEDLEKDPQFSQRKMFGADVASLEGRQVLALTAGDEPWNGLLICTSREHHDSLTREFSELQPHVVLKKWLYISQSDPDFEGVALRIRDLARSRDPRIGIEPKPRRKRNPS